MNLTLPDFCLVALLSGDTGDAQSMLAAHFAADEIVRAGEMARVIGHRLARREPVAVTSGLLAAGTREALLSVSRRHYARAYAIVLADGIDPQALGAELHKEGFHATHVVGSAARPALSIEREPLPMDKRAERGPFDVIGDVHGCADELVELLADLGYRIVLDGSGASRRVLVEAAPAGRRVVFVGDLVDRGPASPDVLRIVMTLVGAGLALAVPGNHDVKFLRWLDGRNVKANHGLDRTIAQLGPEPDAFKADVRAFLDGLVSHAWIDGGDLVIAHAGIKEDMIGRAAGPVREFCLYGERSGETDHLGLPVRYHWAADYAGSPAVIYGHTPVSAPEWVNNTLCIDTGCCFGGRLTALRWPEREIVSVPARQAYAATLRPFGHPPIRPGTKPRV